MDYTHDDVYCFVQVDDDAVLIDYGDCGDATFREHVNNIKHGRVHGGSRNRVIRVLPKLGLSRRGVMLHVSANAEFAERKMEGMNVPSALRRDEKGNDKIQDGDFTLMAMNLRRRYCVRTETMTW